MAQITSQQQTGSTLDQYAQIAAPQLGMTPDQYIQAYNQAAANPTEYGSHVQSNSQDWQNAVNAWNTGGAVSPQFYGALQQINQYYQQGQAAPGKMDPILGQQYLTQKAKDAAPSGNFFSKIAANPLPTAAALVASYYAPEIGSTLSGWGSSAADWASSMLPSSAAASAAPAVASDLASTSPALDTSMINSAINYPVTPDLSAVNAGASTLPTAAASAVPATQSAWDTLAKWGPLGIGVLGMGGQMAQANALSKAMANVGGPQQQIAQGLLQQYQSGQLNPADQYNIDKWTQSATAQAKQYFASAGLSNSSMEADAINQIGAQSQYMKQQALNNLLQQGLSTLNVTDTNQANAIMMELQQSQIAMQTANQFMGAYGNWLSAYPKMTG